VTGYRVESCQGVACSNFAQIATPSATTFNDTGLTGSASYSYRVRATDAAGNLGPYSNTATASTPPTVDTTPPTAPTNLTASPASSSQINLTWTASTDNVGVTGYKLERCQGAGCSNFAQIATPSATTFNDAGLVGSTSYSYRVRATDAAGNLSPYSNAATASTLGQPDTTPPTAPTNLTATPFSSSQINLTWTASTDNVGVTGYMVERCQGAVCSNFAQIATPSTTTFNDTGLTGSASYSYRVRATDAAANLSAYSSIATASTPVSSIAVSITPKRGGLTLSQSLNFSASVAFDPSNSGVTWTASAGSFTSQSVTTATFTAPSAPGVITITATSIADLTKSASATIGVTDLSGVTTYHNDLSRDGANAQEYALTASNVAPAFFAKLFSCSVDAAIYAQPLWIANLPIGGGTHNVIFAATSRDTVYAFDADATPCTTYWKKSLLPAGETWVSSNDVGTGDLEPDVGIVGTPVIDLPSQSIYVVSKSKTNGSNCTPSSSCHQRLHALSLIDGSEKSGSPVDITSSITVPGTGDGSSGGNVPFDPLRENQRPGLALVNGVVYVSWASHGDNGPYHGWVIGYDKATLSRLTVYNDSPNAGQAGIWMGGGAPAADGSNNLYMITGNGTFDGNSSTAPNNDFGDSILKLGTSGGLSLSSWFTPSDESSLNAGDVDLGSGGATVLVDAPSSPKPRLLIGGGKEGNLYLLNRDALGNFGDANAWQIFSLGNGIFATPAFWQNQLYIAGVGGRLKAFQFSPTTGKFNPSQTSQSPTSFGFPGSTPSISATGAANGIVWALDNSQYCTQQASGCGPAVLHAYDAANLATELWNSSQVSTDKAGNAVKFTVPTVANGKVYVGTRGSDSTNGGIGELDVYGLQPN
jgi:chitodextrinase